MRPSTAAKIVGVALGTLLVIASGCSTTATKAVPEQVGFNPITKVGPGMTLLDVLRELPPPNDMKGNTYYYKAMGRIVFEGTGAPTDRTKVAKVEPDRMEDGIAP